MSGENHRPRVLIVDDDESVLMALEWLLETEGYETTTAWSGEAAVQLLSTRRFDVVLIDAELRGMSAAEIKMCLRSCGQKAHCVLLYPSTRLQQIDSVCNLGGELHRGSSC